MLKFLLKRLLLANYSFANRWVNKKMPQLIIPATLHIFVTPFTFIAAGLYFVFIGSIKYKFDSYAPIFIGLVILMLGLGYPMESWAKKAIFRWNIEREYSNLNKNQRMNKNILAFCFFWVGFTLFFYLGVKYFGGYGVK